MTIFVHPLETMPMESHNLEKRQDQVLDLIPIGQFVNTQHQIRGMVWAYNNTLLLIEDFAYDGQGFGVYFQAATEGKLNLSFEFSCHKNVNSKKPQVEF